MPDGAASEGFGLEVDSDARHVDILINGLQLHDKTKGPKGVRTR